MNGDYLDYLAHYRTPGSKNGVSHTPGYDAVGKPAMSEAERKAARSEYRSDVRENFKKGIFRPGYSDRNNSAAVKLADAKAKYAESRGKSAVKQYGKEMYLRGGQPLIKGMKRYGFSKKLYDHLEKTKGSDYADSVVKSAKKRAWANFAAQETLYLGMAAAGIYLTLKASSK